MGTPEEEDALPAPLALTRCCVTLKNTYYICQKKREAPVLWDLYGPEPGLTLHEAYFGGVLRALEAMQVMQGQTVYLTDSLDVLPTYGTDVVAVMTGDEWSCTPHYAPRVRAVFKCYGTTLKLGGNPLRHPTYLNGLAALQYVRSQTHRLPYTLAALRHPGAATNIYPVPLGYATQIEQPFKPFRERSTDVFFAGSLSHKVPSRWSPRRLLRSPKEVSRESMVEALRRFEATHPSYQTSLFLADGFTPHAIRWGRFDPTKMLSPEIYSAAMMDTKICMVPRGTSLETFRYFEALRFGCITITEVLPDFWFYHGAPSISVNRWADLGGVLETLLADEEALEQRHRASLRWWQEVCAEEAVARYMADALTTSLASSATTLRPAP